MFKELPHVYVEQHELKHAAQKYGRLFYHVSGRLGSPKNRATVSLYLRFHLASELFHVIFFIRSFVSFFLTKLSCYSTSSLTMYLDDLVVGKITQLFHCI